MYQNGESKADAKKGPQSNGQNGALHSNTVVKIRNEGGDKHSVVMRLDVVNVCSMSTVDKTDTTILTKKYGRKRVDDLETLLHNSLGGIAAIQADMAAIPKILEAVKKAKADGKL